MSHDVSGEEGFFYQKKKKKNKRYNNNKHNDNKRLSASYGRQHFCKITKFGSKRHKRKHKQNARINK